MSEHRHQTPLRGVRVIPRPPAGSARYTELNYAYAGRTGHIHEVVTIGGQELAKVGFDDQKIVYYLIEDLELLPTPKRTTFHDEPSA